LVGDRCVDVEQALKAATSPHDFKLLLATDGRKGTTMADLEQAEAHRALA
jgi:twitching motility protein PilT